MEDDNLLAEVKREVRDSSGAELVERKEND